MINHARTLLLNVDGASAPVYSYFAEELVSPTFLAAKLAPELQNIRSTLFGLAPDRAMLNYRLRQYMTLLHSTELEEFVLDLDPRITYWPTKDISIFENTIFGASYLQLNTPIKQLWFLGNRDNLVSSSNLLSTWQVTVTDGSHVTIDSIAPGVATTVSSYSVTNGLSSIVNLPNSPLQFRFASGTGSIWQLQTLARPLFDVGDIVVQLSSVRFNDIDAMFSGVTATEPYKTFYNLWTYSDELPYKLGGLLLGLIYKTNELIPGVG